jgi:hypothetical protein
METDGVLKQKVWGELISCFPLIQQGSEEKNYASNNSTIVACLFVVAVTFLPSRCQATVGDAFTHEIYEVHR